MSTTCPRIAAAGLVCALLLVPGSSETLRAQGPSPRSKPLTFVQTLHFVSTGNDQITSRTFTYQGNRQLQLVTVFDGSESEDADGVPNQIDTTTATSFGSHGNPLEDVTTVDVGGNGTVEFRRVTTYTHDNKGNVITQVTDSFNATTDVLLSQQVVTMTWDNHRTLLTRHATFDNISNGIGIDSVQDLTNVVNKKGDILLSTVEIDSDGDGTVDSRNVTTLERHPSGRVLQQTSTIDDPAGGAIEESRTTYDIAWHGNDVISFATDVDDPAGGALEVRQFTTNTIAKGQVTERHVGYDFDLDGNIEVTLTSTFTFDHGDLIESVVPADNDNDGIADVIITQAFTY